MTHVLDTAHGKRNPSPLPFWKRMAKLNATRPYGLLAAIALGALASLVALPSPAATSHKQSVQQAKKPEVKKPEAKKPEVKKPEAKEPDARNSFAKKERSSSKKTAHKRGKPARHAAKSKRGVSLVLFRRPPPLEQRHDPQRV